MKTKIASPPDGNEDPVGFLRGQIFFVEEIVSPLWTPMAVLFPALHPLVGNFKKNAAFYQSEISKLEATAEASRHSTNLENGEIANSIEPVPAPLEPTPATIEPVSAP